METNELEFREMKQQLRLLQERLDKEVEIRDKQLKSAIAEGFCGLRRRDRIGRVVCIVATIFVIGETYFLGLPNYFIISTLIFLIVTDYMAFKHKFNHKALDKMDMVEASKYLIKFKNYNIKAISINLPLAICWVIWFISETCKVSGSTSVSEMLPFIIGGVIGCITGGLIGYFGMFRPSMRDADKLIKQIEELKES